MQARSTYRVELYKQILDAGCYTHILHISNVTTKGDELVPLLGFASRKIDPFLFSNLALVSISSP
jgi:hypothetical protein